MKQITLSELQQWQQARKHFYLIDVREKNEHDAFNIGGELMPVGEIISQAPKIPTDIPVVVYCRKGIRSQIAIQRLEEKFGFTNLINLHSGIGEGKKEE